MRKIQKILLGVFLGGVLLGGIGAGVAFGEYSSITYAGKRTLESEKIVTENLDYQIDLEAGIVEIASAYYDGGIASNIEYDSTVPEGTIRFQVTYNSMTVSPYLQFENPDEEEQEDETQGWLYLTWQGEDDFAVWMENKDMILEDLKKKQIASYQISTITNVRILVNPSMKDLVRMI